MTNLTTEQVKRITLETVKNTDPVHTFKTTQELDAFVNSEAEAKSEKMSLFAVQSALIPELVIPVNNIDPYLHDTSSRSNYVKWVTRANATIDALGDDNAKPINCFAKIHPVKDVENVKYIMVFYIT